MRARTLLERRGMRIQGACIAILLATSACADVASDDDTSATEDALALTKIQVLRGVDRAGVFTTAEAKVLHNQHGVRWTGVYIGGACNGGFGWTPSKVTAIANATHWQFMPIWVGQQASSICHAHDLTANQGKADGKAAVTRMKQFGWKPDRDIPIALDVEAGTYFDHPIASTRYVRAWTTAVRAAGYRADVYGSPFGLNHYHDAHVRIDGAWAASYFYSGFRAVGPGHLDQMGNRYRHQNRAWQYAGNFSVSGAGRVDADTSNMMLAPRPGGTNRHITTHREAPSACGVLQPGEGLAVGESLASCDGHLVLAMTGAGDLQLTRDGAAVWSAGTDGAGATAVLEDNGELVVFDVDGAPVYTSDSGGYPDAQLELTADGLELVDDTSRVWTSKAGLTVWAGDDLDNLDPDDAAD